MEWIIATLLLALVLSLIWGWRQRTRLQPPPSLPESPVPSPDAFSSLFHAAAAAFDDGLVLVDADRRVQYLNAHAEELLNLSRTVSVGQGLIMLARDYQVDAMVEEAIASAEPRESILQPLGRQRTLRLRAVPLDHGTKGALLLVRDVTQLSQLERSRRDLVANVSHELRTPLASIKLLVETLQSDPPAPVAQRMLSQIAQEVDAITQLVEELHELSQIESGRVALQLVPTPLAPLVAHTIERIRPQMERKSIRVIACLPDDLPPALIDGNRVGQVLLNLLHNASKFTPDGGQVAIEASVIMVGDGSPLPPGIPSSHLPGQWLLVSIADNGIGIPARDLARIFERFYKVDRARTRNAGGTGLGLAIAKHLVEGHGGRIWATSVEGEGSIFYLTLPVA
ncbi:sensor histidine kinase [Roseiflexus castenholzii]|jgi:two-component system phosphate regulon sensor histidine kinase PhoR|uniref:histidine kinase n=1 Tax=Roseiflexus castenholzii (strain DSM 13941 / HLO8) TaxID=383372 RepID=A7NI07_ROSCS|nr:ATP-binding protein [Roseiflexus castenholzii]ABU57104.1 PAS/PAC sensor signal transduction histidine kinase [Roseiflexus castenholzii DSM 13941]